MKKLFGLIVCLLLVSLCTFALADVAINETNFPDAVFREYVQQFDTDGNGSFSDEELAAVTTIDVDGKKELTTLAGIEFFTELTRFEGQGAHISSLDISKNTKLEYIYAGYNEWTELDLSKNVNLKYLHITHCCLTSLNLSNNINLEQIYIGHNQITSLDVSNLKKLWDLSFPGNPITKIDVSGNPELMNLICTAKGLTEIDISHNPKLNSIMTYGSRIMTVDARNCPDLCKVIQSGPPELKTEKSDGRRYWYWDYMLEGHGECMVCLNLKTRLITPDGDYQFPAYDPVPVSSITLDQSEAALTITSADPNPTLQLTAAIDPVDAENPTVSWSSSNEEIATVDKYGLVTALKKGKTTITCAAMDGSGIVAECNITIEDKQVTSIKLNKTKATLTRTSEKKKPTLQLTATVTPADATNTAVKWSSSDTSVAKVDKNGKVTALKSGTATITCEAKDGSGAKATCKITVKNKLVTKITLNKTKYSLKKGKTFQLQVKTLKPATALNQKVKWTSSNKKVAKVDSTGKVTAVKKGTCTITCTAADGSGVKTTCTITVK